MLFFLPVQLRMLGIKFLLILVSTGICFLLISGCGDDADKAFCGNDKIENAEDCDGTALNRATCDRLGFDGGTLSCGDGCEYDYSGCGGCCDEGQCLVFDYGVSYFLYF